LRRYCCFKHHKFSIVLDIRFHITYLRNIFAKLLFILLYLYLYRKRPVFSRVLLYLSIATRLYSLTKGTKSMTEYNPNRLLTRKEAADFLGVKEVTLAIWKSNKRYDIPVVKVGRLAKYRYSDLLEFVERRTVNRPANDNKDVH